VLSHHSGASVGHAWGCAYTSQCQIPDNLISNILTSTPDMHASHPHRGPQAIQQSRRQRPSPHHGLVDIYSSLHELTSRVVDQMPGFLRHAEKCCQKWSKWSHNSHKAFIRNYGMCLCALAIDHACSLMPKVTTKPRVSRTRAGITRYWSLCVKACLGSSTSSWPAPATTLASSNGKYTLQWII